MSLGPCHVIKLQVSFGLLSLCYFVFSLRTHGQTNRKSTIYGINDFYHLRMSINSLFIDHL